jgi:hypothetical protein
MSDALISNPNEIKEIRGALQEISDAMHRMEAEKELIKEIKATLHEEHKDKLTKKDINKLAKTFHKESFHVENAEFDKFSYLYQTITGENEDS